MRQSMYPENPALTLSAIISTIRLNPALVGESPTTFCRYMGRKMLRPTIALHPQAWATTEASTVGLRSTLIGISGSGAVRSRHTKPAPTASAIANSARIGGDVQA